MPRHLFLFARVLVIGALLAGCHRPEVDVAPLTVAPQGRTLRGGETHVYTVDLAPGEYVEVEAVQQGIDVTLSVRGPDGTTGHATNHRQTSRGAEWLPLVAVHGGRHRILVTPAEPLAEPGGYTIRVLARRSASVDDRERLRAAEMLAEAEALLEIPSVDGFKKAYTLAAAALDTWTRQALPIRQAETLYAMSFAAGRYAPDKTEGIALTERALGLYRAAGDASAIGVLVGEALASYALAEGRVEHAFDLAGEGLGWCRQSADLVCEARVLRLLAQCEAETNRLVEGLEHHRRAQQLFHAAGRQAEELSALSDLATTSSLLGDDDSADDYRARALTLARAAHERSSAALVLVNIGRARVAVDPAGALPLIEQGLGELRTIGYGNGQAAALIALAKAEQPLGRNDSAAAHLDEAVTLARSSPAREAQALEARGALALVQRRLDRAAADLEAALALCERLADRVARGRVLGQLALVDEARGEHARALRRIADAIAGQEALRDQLLDERRLFFGADADSRQLYATQIALLMHDRARPDASQREALRVSERLHGRMLRETLAGAGVGLPATVDPQLRARERALRDDVHAIARAQRAASAAGRPIPNPAALSQKLAEYEALRVTLARRYPAVAALTPDEVPSVDALQRLLDHDTLLVELRLGRDESYLWLLSDHSFAAYILPGQAELEPLARRLFESARARALGDDSDAARGHRLDAADAAFDAAAHALSDRLLGPVADQLGDRRLVIVAEGALQYVSFGALPLPGHPHVAGGAARPEPVLLDRHELVELPSASWLPLVRARAGARPAARELLAVVADPVFDAGDARVQVSGHSALATAATADALRGDALRTAREAGLADLARLRWSRVEGETIVALAHGAPTSAAFDFDASRERVLAGAVADARIVHFATHGLVDSRTPERSALVLSLVDAKGAPRDGLLRLADLYGLRLSADLVVLSACQTALGREIQGEGLIGLVRGFMQVGVPEVIASLWSVDERATAELMQRFYRRVLAAHEAPAAALRAAQLELRRDPRWRAPFYWAAFVLQGDWRWRVSPTP